MSCVAYLGADFFRVGISGPVLFSGGSVSGIHLERSHSPLGALETCSGYVPS